MRFLSAYIQLRCSTAFITYLILIQLSTSCADPVRSSRRSEVRSSFASQKYANIESRTSDYQDNQQLANENHETVLVDVKNPSEDLIATTDNSLPLEDPVDNFQSSPAGPSELLVDISGSTDADAQSEYVTDPSIDPAAVTPDVVAIDHVSSDASASTTPMDLPLYPAVRVPTAPESAGITAAPLVAGTNNLPSTEVPVLAPVTLPELILNNNTESGVKKTTPILSLKYGVPKGGDKQNLPKHRPIKTSYYNPPDTINPYLGEELDKPIYLPPTFPGPAALPAAINLDASDEDNFPPIPFGNSKPKKLEFPPVSNTDENFGYQIDWW
ncbi:hypothetical protein DAPPUDRAFT_98339 [Daphnia pulex]|uniref:Uncharacterized protein n=1 Tax=Daphnia pulex TaxID=6669 RepID=E9G3D0_DAPPU|nr:hypothetical protein DAPPUDRAFT_98339 [Daphnia pulex]|eukprot:EFX85750.1 hypothetical protein DAPPUDRAFT_98339 [Daphnia pulex]